MSIYEKYDKLKRVIQAANPEIMELKFGCNIGLYGGEIFYTVINRISICKKHKRTKEDCYAEENGCELSDGVQLVTTSEDQEFIYKENKKISEIREFEIYGRPIKLADVMMAIKRTQHAIAIRDDGRPMLCKGNDWLPLMTSDTANWNFKKDDLDEQSDSIHEFLINLLL